MLPDIKSQTRAEVESRFKDWQQSAYRVGQLLDFVPNIARTSLAHSLSAASKTGHSSGGAFTEILEPDLPDPYFASRLVFSQRHIARLLGKTDALRGQPSAWGNRERQLAGAAHNLAPVDRVSFFELQTYMLSTLLRDSDQMSMATVWS